MSPVTMRAITVCSVRRRAALSDATMPISTRARINTEPVTVDRNAAPGGLRKADTK